jgi:predicted DNA-binding transcriptional regulator AlpA
MEMFRTHEAAQYIGMRKSTLEAWRVRGGGPPYIKLSKAVRYRKADLDQFIVSRVRENTSQQVPNVGCKA